MGEKLQVANDMDTYTIREPLGVVGGICPNNFPAMIPLWMVRFRATYFRILLFFFFIDVGPFFFDFSTSVAYAKCSPLLTSSYPLSASHPTDTFLTKLPSSFRFTMIVVHHSSLWPLLVATRASLNRVREIQEP